MRPEPLTLCACQWGICGACKGDSDPDQRPRHDRCLSRQHGHPIVYPLTWLTDKHGFVAGAALWPADGPSCRYICSCPCPKTGPAPAAPLRRRPARQETAPAPEPDPAPADLPCDDGALFDLEMSA